MESILPTGYLQMNSIQLVIIDNSLKLGGSSFLATHCLPRVIETTV